MNLYQDLGKDGIKNVDGGSVNEDKGAWFSPTGQMPDIQLTWLSEWQRLVEIGGATGISPTPGKKRDARLS